METKVETSIHRAFETIYDPREAHKVEHPIINIIFIAICGVLCGANNWTQISEFGESQEEWLSQFLDMSKGIPSHDTFGDLFGALHCEEFADKFREWMKLLSPEVGRHVAIDGQLPRGSKDNALGQRAIDIVSAFATENGLTLAQQKVDGKSNEITAIPRLLRLLNLKGTVVTIDAMGCHTEIATEIDNADGDYVLSLKGNQGHLFEDTVEMFAYFQKIDFKATKHTSHRTVNGGHGRVEVRQAWAFSPHDHAQYFRTLDRWPALQSVVMVYAERRFGDKIESETRYFISSLPPDAETLLQFIRNHWKIENSLHWVLDVAFRQDQQRIRKAHSAANFVTLHHLVLNLFRLDKSRGGIETKRLKCGWDTKFRLKILAPILPAGFVN